jgi:CDP-diacylglycerol---serine O-phosphatidyltransferase
MNIKKHIPNFLTCCNLLCGCLGIIAVFQLPDLAIPSYLIFAACIFDFLDGFIARLLKVQSPIGKELDSLADVITFGVLPGMIIYRLMEGSLFISFISYFCDPQDNDSYSTGWKYALIALSIPVFSALRLAKFNIDTRQSESFIGVPTPANAILIASLPLIINSFSPNAIGGSWTIYPPLSAIYNEPSPIIYHPIVSIILNPYFLIGLTLLMSYLLVAELPLFALKFKNFKWPGNEIRFIFLGLSVVLLIALKWLGIPIIIFLYIILSVLNNTVLKKPSENPQL